MSCVSKSFSLDYWLMEVIFKWKSAKKMSWLDNPNCTNLRLLENVMRLLESWVVFMVFKAYTYSQILFGMIPTIYGKLGDDWKVIQEEKTIEIVKNRELAGH